MTRTKKKGYVYLIKYDDTHFKIGESKDIPVRFKRLTKRKKGSIIHTIETDDVRQLESYFHNIFNLKLVADEIFSLSEDDISQFKQNDKVIYEPTEYYKEPEKKNFDEKWANYVKDITETFEEEIEVFNRALEKESEFLLNKFPCMTKEDAKEICKFYLFEFFSRCIFSRPIRMEDKKILPFMEERSDDFIKDLVN